MAARNAAAPWAILTTILIGTFLGTLANSVANVALPAVMAQFNVPLSAGVWVVTLYVLLFAILMPVSGYLGDLYGQRRMYLAGMALFTLASLGSGLAPSFPWLLITRVLQGIGIAPILPAVMSMIARTFTPDLRGRAIGFWALANSAGHALGPPLSGALTQVFSWRAVFFAGLPLCLLTLLLVWWLVPPDEAHHTSVKFDLGGAITLTMAALGVMLALTQSTRLGLASLTSIGLWAMTLAALAVFVSFERRVASPLVELDLFANRGYTAAIAVIGAQIFCLFGLLLALPVFLIGSQGWDSRTTGLLVFPLPLTMALISPLAGRLADLRGSRWTCTIGMAVVGLAGLAMLGLQLDSVQSSAWWKWAGCLIAMGIGMGLTQSPSASAATQVVPQQQLGVATGIFHMGRFLSGTLGSTVFGLVLQTDLGNVAVGLQHDLWLLVGMAALAVVLARLLPGRAERLMEKIAF